MVGAILVIAVDEVAEKLAMAKARGATRCIDASKTADLAGETRKVVGLRRSDKVIETIGVKLIVELAYDVTRPDGTCVLVGVLSEKVAARCRR